MPKSYFPPQTLKSTLIIPQTIYSRNSGQPIFRVTLADEIGLGSEGDKFRELITSSAGYGFTTGSYIAEKIELEPRGEEVAKGNIDEIINGLFSIEVFQKFYDHFTTGSSKSVPSDKAAKDFLERDCNVPARQVPGVLISILQNARDWQLIQDIAGGEKLVPIDLAKKKIKSLGGLSVVEAESIIAQPAQTTPVETRAIPAVEIPPKLQLNIEIHIGADVTDDKIETIFKNMKKYLLTNE